MLVQTTCCSQHVGRAMVSRVMGRPLNLLSSTCNSTALENVCFAYIQSLSAFQLISLVIA